MPGGYDIEVSPKSFNDVKAAVKGLGDEVKLASDRVQGLQRALKETGDSAKTIGGRPMSVVGKNDPWSRYGVAQQALYNGYVSGEDPSVLKRLAYEEEMARRRMLSAERLLNPEAKEESPHRTANNGPRSKTFTLAKGANQNLDVARHELDIALASGDQGLIDDAKANVRRKEEALQRQNKLLNGPSREDAVMEAFMSSRMAGGRLLPLVNKLRKAGMSTAEDLESELGLSPAMAQKLAPIVATAAAAALPLAGGLIAGGAIVGLMTSAAATGRRSSDAFWSAGGTPLETARLMALGGDASKAMAFGDALRRGSYGSAYMNSRGIYDLGPYSIDKAGNYVRGIDELRKIKSDQQAIRVARDLGLSDELWRRDLDPEQYDRIKRSMDDLATPQARKAYARYRGAGEEFSNQWEKFKMEQGTPWMEAGADALGARGFWHQAGTWLQLAAMGTAASSLVLGPEMLIPAAALELLGLGAEGIGNRTDPKARSVKPEDLKTGNGIRMRNAQRRWSNEVETLGGGSRTAGALPPGYVFQYQDDGFTAASLNLGAFNVG